VLDWIGRRRHKRRMSNGNPATEIAPELQPPDHGAAEQPTTRRVLVIDDDLFIGRMMIDLLGSSYDVEVACDATEAGLAIERRHPNLIILDIMMPGQDGQEIGHQLQRHIAPIRYLSSSSAATSVSRRKPKRFTRRATLPSLSILMSWRRWSLAYWRNTNNQPGILHPALIFSITCATPSSSLLAVI
jgi:CheY-like chemotaxis protein